MSLPATARTTRSSFRIAIRLHDGMKHYVKLTFRGRHRGSDSATPGGHPAPSTKRGVLLGRTDDRTKDDGREETTERGVRLTQDAWKSPSALCHAGDWGLRGQLRRGSAGRSTLGMHFAPAPPNVRARPARTAKQLRSDDE